MVFVHGPHPRQVGRGHRHCDFSHVEHDHENLEGPEEPLLRQGSNVTDATPLDEGSEYHVAPRLKLRRASRYISSSNLSNTAGLGHKVEGYEMTWKQYVWVFLNSNLGGEGRAQKWAQRYEYSCALLILLNVLADVLDSVPQFPFTEDNSPAFRVLERASCLVFTLDYVLRVWSCVDAPEAKGSYCARRWRFAKAPLPAVDLLVVMVFYLDIFMSSDESRGFQSLRMVRTLRLVALLKMERQTRSFQTVFRVFHKKRHDLFATLFLAMVLLVIASTAMYYVETQDRLGVARRPGTIGWDQDQPDKFESIPSTMWWSVTAMTTVGYGDIYPTTVPGKVLGSVVAFLGVGLFALPSGIISSGFVEVLEEQRQADADDLAEILDEDKASIDKLREEVMYLRKQSDIMQSRMQRVEDDATEARKDQKRALAILERLVAAKPTGEQPQQRPQSRGELPARLGTRACSGRDAAAGDTACPVSDRG